MCSRIRDEGRIDKSIQNILLSIRANSSNGNPHSNYEPTVVYLEVESRGKAEA